MEEQDLAGAGDGTTDDFPRLYADGAQLDQLSDCLRDAVSDDLKHLGKDYSQDVLDRTQDALIRHLVEPAMDIITKNVIINEGKDDTNTEAEVEPYDDLLNRGVIYLQEEVLAKVGDICALRSQAPDEIAEALKEALASTHTSLEEHRRAFSEPVPIPPSQTSISIPDRERALQDLDAGVSYLEGIVEFMPEYLERAARAQTVQSDLTSLVQPS